MLDKQHSIKNNNKYNQQNNRNKHKIINNIHITPTIIPITILIVIIII
jgi:hypothetical protein